jgi:hypothetical protein
VVIQILTEQTEVVGGEQVVRLLLIPGALIIVRIPKLLFLKLLNLFFIVLVHHSWGSSVLTVLFTGVAANESPASAEENRDHHVNHTLDLTFFVEVLEHRFEPHKESQNEIQNILRQHHIRHANDVFLSRSTESMHEPEVETKRNRQEWDRKKALKHLNCVLNITWNVNLPFFDLMENVHDLNRHIEELNA